MDELRSKYLNYVQWVIDNEWMLNESWIVNNKITTNGY